MDFRINETLQTGAVENRTYQVRGESVYLFLEFTISDVDDHRSENLCLRVIADREA